MLEGFDALLRMHLMTPCFRVGEELAPARHLSHRVSEVAVSSATGRVTGQCARSEQARPSGWLHGEGRHNLHPGRAPYSPTSGPRNGVARSRRKPRHGLATRGRSARVAPGGTERRGDGALLLLLGHGALPCLQGTGVQGESRVGAISGWQDRWTHYTGAVSTSGELCSPS